MKEKQLYTAPEADLLVVRFEENLLNGSQWDTATQIVIWGDDVDL